MRRRDLQHVAQGATEAASIGVIVRFPVVNKRNTINVLGHSEAYAGAANVVQDELRMAKARDALLSIVEELEALRRKVADAIASR